MLAHPFRRMMVGAMVATVATAGVAVAAATPAHAQALDVNCVGTLSTTLSPGLRLTSQTITTENHFIYNPCTSTDGTLTYGTFSSTIVGKFSCLDPLKAYTDTKTIEWSNGETSTFEFNGTFNTTGGQFVTLHTGVITAGQFAGDTAVETIVGPTLDLVTCALPPGITSRTSVVTLNIIATS